MIQIQPLTVVVFAATLLLLSSNAAHGRVYQTDDAIIVEGMSNYSIWTILTFQKFTTISKMSNIMTLEKQE